MQTDANARQRLERDGTFVPVYGTGRRTTVSMRSLRPVLVVVLAAGLVAPAVVLAAPGASAGSAAASAAGTASASTSEADAPPAALTAATEPARTAATEPAQAESNNTSVSVGLGKQLSTVIAASESDVGTEVEATAFEASFERGDAGERAEVVAERAEDLRERAREIREDYREAAREFEAGELSRSEYAQRLAVLNVRARNVLASHERLERRAENVSDLELASAGLNRTALRLSIRSLDDLTGAGPTALLERFTGQRRGEIEIERADGFSIEVESEDGERSREVERSRDDDTAITVEQSAALETARSVLSEQDGDWVLERASVHSDSGYYRFRFALASANATGEAEVRIDGSTGAEFRIEEEIERLADDERDGNDPDVTHEENEVDDVSLLVSEGTPAPDATVTLRAVADGEALANATVRLNGDGIGTTGPDGTIEVTLPAGSSTFVVVAGDEDAELEFEFEDHGRERSPVFRHLDVDATLDGDTVALAVRYGGTGVENVTVYANDRTVGTTDADGRLTFAIDVSDELHLELVRGELEAELGYRIVNDSLVLVERAAEGDGDKIEDAGDAVDDLQLSLVDGDPARNATVTVQVTAAGDPVANATVAIDGAIVGETDADGRLVVTLPASDEVELTALAGGEDAELEFEFQERESDDDEETETPEPTEPDETETSEPTESDETETPEPDETETPESDDVEGLTLSVVAGDPAPGAMITIEVTASGDPVSSATVSVEGAVAGETGADGTIDVTLPADEDDPRVRAEIGDLDGRIEFDFDD